jgi:hypothetical protein
VKPTEPTHTHSVIEQDREFLEEKVDRAEEKPIRQQSHVVSPPRQLDPLDEEDVARRPVENAPARAPHARTLQRAQRILYDGGYYDGKIDGVPGRETTEALMEFQNDAGIRRTGRLDFDTMDEMGLLEKPSEAGSPYEPFMRERDEEPSADD